MLSSNEAAVFDFPDQDSQVRLQNRPNLVLIYDSERDEVLDVIDINELPGVPEVSESTLDINHQQLGNLDAYRLYSFRLDQYPRLSAEQEQILTKQLATEDEAKRLMLLHNQPLVIALAKHYPNRRLELMDHIQTGLIGLDKATKKFDPSLSARFGPQAGMQIKSAIRGALYESYRPYNLNKMARVARVGEFLAQEYLRQPTPAEISDFSDLEEDDIKVYQRVGSIGVVSLDVPLPSGDGATVRDLIPSKELLVEEQVEIQELRDVIQGLIDKHLNEREAFVIRQQFGMNESQTPMTMEDLAKELKVHRSRISQIKARAMEKLKEPILTYWAGAEVPDV